MVVTLAVTTGLVYLSQANDDDQDSLVGRTVLTLTSPIQWLVTNVTQGVSDTWNRYVSLVGAAEENAELLDELERVRLENQELRALKSENARLQSLFDYASTKAEWSTVLGRVIGLASSPMSRGVILDVGEDQGVYVGAPVISSAGAVGRVVTVSARASSVVLLVDSNHSTDVRVERTRARASIRGSGSDQTIAMETNRLRRTEDVVPGDIFVTSGLAGIFPSSVPVAKVIEVSRPQYGLYQEVEVSPLVRFDRLEEVVVMLRKTPLEASDRFVSGDELPSFEGDVLVP